MTDDPTTLPTAPAADTVTKAAKPRRNWLVALPLVLFGGLAAIFLYQLVSGHDPQQIPSVLIGKTAPQTVLPALDEPGRSAKAAAILVLVGFVNIPIIKFSVDWWNTLHQSASVIRVDGPAMPPVFLIPLLVSAAGFTLLFFALHLTAMRTEVLRRRVAALSRLAARRAEA